MGWLSGVAKGVLGAVNPVGLIGTVGAGILGGVGDIYSASQANRSAEAIANKQMEFQQSMSNTAHQREVEDLKKAGLNPLLSVNSGASTPGGASSPVTPVPYSRVVASAMEMVRFQRDMKLLDETINNAKETGYNTRESTEQIFEDRRGSRLENDFIEKRNRFFARHPNLYALHAASGGMNSLTGGASAVAGAGHSAMSTAAMLRALLK